MNAPPILALLAPDESLLRPFGAVGPDLGRYVLVCAVLVVLAGGLLLALRKGLAAGLRARASRRSLSVIDVLPLGGRQRVLVLRCYDRTFLIGAGDKELTPIAELDASVGGEAPQKDPLPADREAFARALEAIRKTLPAPKLGASAAAGKPSLVPKTLTPATAARPSPEASAPAPPSAPPQERARPRLEGVVG